MFQLVGCYLALNPTGPKHIKEFCNGLDGKQKSIRISIVFIQQGCLLFQFCAYRFPKTRYIAHLLSFTLAQRGQM